jgi:hypothetical protein
MRQALRESSDRPDAHPPPDVYCSSLRPCCTRPLDTPLHPLSSLPLQAPRLAVCQYLLHGRGLPPRRLPDSDRGHRPKGKGLAVRRGPVWRGKRRGRSSTNAGRLTQLRGSCGGLGSCHAPALPGASPLYICYMANLPSLAYTPRSPTGTHTTAAPSACWRPAPLAPSTR